MYGFGFQLVALVAVISLALYFYMGIRVSQARIKHGVKPPSVSGPAEFERIYRVHQNTAEGLILYLPSLFLFGIFVHDYIAAAVGMLWIIGRYVYMEAYVEDPEKRVAGFGIQALAMLILLLGTLVGIIWGMLNIGSIL